MQWNQENIIKLIEIYRAKEVLWDPKHKHYFNKILKNDAWLEISEQMNFSVSIEELKKKMDSLLAQLRREKTKMKKSTGQGADEVYRSSWYAYEHLTFLFERNKPRSRMNSEELQEPINENSTTSTAPSQIEESQNFEDQPENFENVHSSVEQNASQNNFRNPIFKSPSTKRKKANDSDSRMISSAFEMLSSATAAVKEASARATSDDSQIYANFIASKFRTYSQRTKNALQHQINNLLFQADNGHFEGIQQPSYTSLQSVSPSIINESSDQPNYVQLLATSPTSEGDTQDSFNDLLNSHF